MKSANLSWEENPPRPTLRNINLEVKPGQKIAICGEVGSGKPTLLSAILGEVPSIQGTVQVFGTVAYVSQSAWIQTGSIRENILFGSPLDSQRYQQTLEKCSLLKDLELLPFGDLTEIGERGANLSGGQKQRIQLARALYQNADIYLLDDPFSAVDGHTASSLFNLMSDGEILHAAPYHELLASTKEFEDLVNAHEETAGSERVAEITQNSWMAAHVDNPQVGTLRLITVYLVIGVVSTLFLLSRSLSTVFLGLQSSNSLFSQLLNSLFRAPMSFGEDIKPEYYYASAKELMRINGTTKSFVANHLAESIARVVTIRAFKEEDRFFMKTFKLIVINNSPFFHNFAANEWLIQRLETISATSALCMVLLPSGTFSSGFIGMALSYGLSLNMSLVFSFNNQCTLANYIIYVERLNQYMHIPSEAPEIVNENRPPVN
ncbi:hypothetical protein K7X08_025026 [Anisodus acutangulus]|uniref:ABC-type xenobiotic transporter n=1 Tax=Anisodus acutangulus TaxID=402998 RepID=A0A9Q1RGI4_9SOLA|nr:hypothetical protein K7X08_025026 [Anisodus acutangulus]